ATARRPIEDSTSRSQSDTLCGRLERRWKTRPDCRHTRRVLLLLGPRFSRCRTGALLMGAGYAPLRRRGFAGGNAFLHHLLHCVAKILPLRSIREKGGVPLKLGEDVSPLIDENHRRHMQDQHTRMLQVLVYGVPRAVAHWKRRLEFADEAGNILFGR